MKHLITAFAILAASSAAAGDAKKPKKVKAPKVAVVQVAPAPAPAVTPAPAPAPSVTPAPTAAPKPSYMDQQIAKALANTAPVGVTTYGAMAAAVAAGQNGGDPVAAAQAASAGMPAGQ